MLGPRRIVTLIHELDQEYKGTGAEVGAGPDDVDTGR
jgi:hypothetical protein